MCWWEIVIERFEWRGRAPRPDHAVVPGDDGERSVTGSIDRIEQQPDGGLVVIDFKTGSSAGITKNTIREDIQMNLYCIAVQEIYGKLPVRASLYYLKDNKMVDYIPDESSIAAVCAEEFVAKPSFMGCQRCDYRDLCEVGEKGEE